ncbi:MAG: DUF3343 domain-containing protein [Clostridia bacterium]|nr:DUF3343 domain-containing protein [Clostridia bacterium]
MTVLAVFRSRSQTLDFAARLGQTGVTVKTVNTPREAGVGCGLSAKFDSSALWRARAILRRRYSSFVGLYEIRQYGGMVMIR